MSIYDPALSDIVTTCSERLPDTVTGTAPTATDEQADPLIAAVPALPTPASSMPLVASAVDYRLQPEPIGGGAPGFNPGPSTKDVVDRVMAGNGMATTGINYRGARRWE